MRVTFFLIITLITAPFLCHAEAIPDGSTNTSVSIDSAGRQVVDIATANADRISHNRYTKFDVGANGMLVNNRLAAARTIIHEVTGTDISDINGDVRIQGTRAHMIIANPNGININGATFYNTGAVGLTTGSVGYVTRSTPLGGTQDNPVVTTGDGMISVGDQGIAGVMNRLDLISKKIQISGTITNEHESPFSSVSLHAGNSSTEFNPNLSVADPGGQWFDVTATPATPADSIAIDITRPASIVASSLQIMVTDTGAGVKLSGEAIASQNNFSISADGHVQIEGSATAAGNLEITSATAEVHTTSSEQAKLESQNAALTINTSGNFNNYGGLLSGATEDATNANSLAGVTLNVGGTFTQSTIGDSEHLRAVTLSLTDIDVNAKNINNYAGRFIANTGMTIDAEVFNNTVITAEVENRGEVQTRDYLGRRLWYSFFLAQERVYETSLNYGEPVSGRFSSDIIATTGDVTINVNTLNSIGSEIILNEGSLTINADTIYHEAALAGRAKLTMRCELGGCNRDGFSTIDLIGGKWQASGNIELNASQSITNIGGTFLAINDLVLDSPSISVSSVQTVDVLTRNQGLRSLFLHDDALWIQADQGGTLLANMGKLVIDSDNPVLIDGGLYDAGSGLESNVDVKIVREPTSKDLFIRRHGGILTDIF